MNNRVLCETTANQMSIVGKTPSNMFVICVVIKEPLKMQQRKQEGLLRFAQTCWETIGEFTRPLTLGSRKSNI